MDEERIAITQLADDLQVRKQRLFKMLPRLGILTTQRRDPARGNQMIATVTPAEAKQIRAAVELPQGKERLVDGKPGMQLTDDTGYFYLIQLGPEHDPGRFKVGFTVDLDGRLQKHRCAAPFAVYLKQWPCLRAWERTAIDCVTAGCARLHTEVFRSGDLAQCLARADSLFQLMPEVDLRDDDAGAVENPAVGA